MFTNALLLNDENAEKLAEAGLYSIFVSIDSLLPEEHDSFRGMSGLFDIAVEEIKCIKERGVLVGISSYASKTATERGMYINEIMKYSEKIFNSSTIPPLSSQSWQNSVEGFLSGIGCLAANIQYYVSAYGEVSPCGFALPDR